MVYQKKNILLILLIWNLEFLCLFLLKKCISVFSNVVLWVHLEFLTYMKLNSYWKLFVLQKKTFMTIFLGFDSSFYHYNYGKIDSFSLKIKFFLFKNLLYKTKFFRNQTFYFSSLILHFFWPRGLIRTNFLTVAVFDR